MELTRRVHRPHVAPIVGSVEEVLPAPSSKLTMPLVPQQMNLVVDHRIVLGRDGLGRGHRRTDEVQVVAREPNIGHDVRNVDDCGGQLQVCALGLKGPLPYRRSLCALEQEASHEPQRGLKILDPVGAPTLAAGSERRNRSTS